MLDHDADDRGGAVFDNGKVVIQRDEQELVLGFQAELTENGFSVADRNDIVAGRRGEPGINDDPLPDVKNGGHGRVFDFERKQVADRFHTG